MLSGVIARDVPDPDIAIPGETDMALQLEGQFRRMWSVRPRQAIVVHIAQRDNVVGDSAPIRIWLPRRPVPMAQC